MADQIQSCMQIPLQHYQEDCQRFALQRNFAKGFEQADIQAFQNLYEQRPRAMVIDEFANLAGMHNIFHMLTTLSSQYKSSKTTWLSFEANTKAVGLVKNKADPVQHHD